MFDQRTRAYLYRVALAALMVLVAYGLVGSEEMPVWAEVAGAVLGIGSAGLASLNTSTRG